MKKTLSFILVILMISFSVPFVRAEETRQYPTERIISVSASEIINSDFASAVQNALNTAKDNATEDNPYLVKAEPGTYDLTTVLRIFSNTTLDLSGVTLIRTNDGNMLRVGTEDTVNTGATGYDYYKNIKVIGGTFDGNYSCNTIIKAFHTTNFTMDGCSLLNEKNGHMTEFAGVDGLYILNCSFKDQLLEKGYYGYEAVQLDVLHPFHVTGARCEDLCCQNVLVESCSFDNVPRGVGSHTSVLNNPHHHIVIRGNSFTDMTSIAIQGAGWQDVDIRSNYIDNAPRGITVLNAAIANSYLPSALAAKGDTTAHFSDTLQAPTSATSDINIAYNELHHIGTTADPYAWYSSQGIAAIGTKLMSKSPVDPEDESGGIPAGDYMLDNVSIHDNFIDIRGNGIRIEYALHTDIRNNEIICSKNTVEKDNFYGIVLRNSSCQSGISVWNNYINGAEINGVQLDKINGASVGRNRIHHSGKYGIVCYDSEIDCYSGNFVNTCVNAGLKTVSASKVGSIDHNRVTGSEVNGIHIDSDCSCNIVEENLVYNCNGYIQYNRSKGLVNMGNNYDAPVPAETIEFNGEGLRMGVRTAYMLEHLYPSGNIVSDYTYSVRDPEIAQIDAYGRVTALSEGVTDIDVIADSGAVLRLPLIVEGNYENDPYLIRCTDYSATADPNPIFLGDADADGYVDIIDATLVQRFCAVISDGYDDTISQRCDVNADDLIDVDDAAWIQRAILDIYTGYPIGKPMR